MKVLSPGSRSAVDRRCVASIVVLLALAFALAHAAPASAAFGYLTQWGGPGSGEGQFQAPFGIAVDASGNVYVADCQLNRVQEFTGVGEPIRQLGAKGKGNGQFECARDVAVDATGVYVIDYYNNRVEKFNGSGEYISQWNNSEGGHGVFVEPVSIAADGKGHVYVGDHVATSEETQRVQRFDTTGKWQALVGKAGSGSGQYGKPLGLAADGTGSLYVSDQTYSRVVKFNSAGNPAGEWGEFGSGNGQFGALQQGIATDAANNVYVADWENNRIEKFTSTGTYLGQWGTTGSGNGEFNEPMDVATGPSESVYIADAGNDRIVKYGPGGVSAVTVVTGAATAVTATGATLNGTINPQGTPTSYRFEYGTTASYGSLTSIAADGSGNSDVAVAAPISGLTLSTLYHFRLVALQGGNEVASGEDATFTTSPSPGEATGCARVGHTIGSVGVCADAMTYSGGVWTASGNVILDGGVSAGDGPLLLNDGLASITSSSSVTLSVLRSPSVTIGSGILQIQASSATDSVSGRTALSSLTIGSPLTMALGAIPFVPLLSDYLDPAEGGGVIVTGRPSFDMLGPLAGASLPTGSFSLGIHKNASGPFKVLGGSIRWDGIELGGGWKLGTFSIGYSEGPPSAWTFMGAAEFPFFSSISGLEISGATSNGSIDAIGVKLKTPGVPLGTTGIILDTFGGSLKGLSGGSGNPLIISALVGGGWTKTALPDPFNWIIHIKEVSLSINTSGSGTLAGELDLLDGEGRLAKATASLTIQISPSFLASGALDAQFNALLVSALLHTQAAMNSQHFTAQGSVSGKVLGLTVGSGSGVVSDAGIGATTQICFWFFGKHCYAVGVGLRWANVTGFPPKVEAIGADINRYVTISAHASAAPRPVRFNVARGRPFLDIEARGADADAFELISPSGVRYRPGAHRPDLYSQTLAGGTASAIVVYAPRPGSWQLRSLTTKRNTYNVQAIPALGTVRARKIAPASSKRRPLARKLKKLVLSWAGSGLPRDTRVALYVSSSAKAPGTLVRGGLRVSARTSIATKQLKHGANYLYLVLSSRRIAFSVARFPAPVWWR
jgi:sugar lactone lactonase YvrE